MSTSPIARHVFGAMTSPPRPCAGIERFSTVSGGRLSASSLFYDVTYSQLVAIADQRAWRKKTYNNALSVLRRAFDFGYRDRPLEPNPARSLRGARLRKNDRPKVDPFCMHDAEILIAAIHRDWGAAQGNYDEFRFFTLWAEVHNTEYVAAQFMCSPVPNSCDLRLPRELCNT